MEPLSTHSCRSRLSQPGRLLCIYVPPFPAANAPRTALHPVGLQALCCCGFGVDSSAPGRLVPWLLFCRGKRAGGLLGQEVSLCDPRPREGGETSPRRPCRGWQGWQMAMRAVRAGRCLRQRFAIRVQGRHWSRWGWQSIALGFFLVPVYTYIRPTLPFLSRTTRASMSSPMPADAPKMME